jgi:alkyl sulfatase BDS1-like metallo-beta-lactamase superfamily hydrolase
MADLMEMAERAWRAEHVPEQSHPFSHLGLLAEVRPGTAFVASFGNVSVFQTASGLVLVDTGARHFAAANHGLIRDCSELPVHTAIYTHGHVDHVFGIEPFEVEAEAGGWDRPRVVAHENVPARFDRYRRTAGYNEIINRRQFQAPGLRWPREYRYPDIFGADRITLALTETAEVLESLESQALDLINRGATLADVLESVQPPPALQERPYLRPIYDEAEFVVRNIWRLYTGWWDGNPAHLKPAAEAQLAAELADLAGGPGRLAERALELAGTGDLRLAGHLAELARRAAPDDPGVAQAYHLVNTRRAESEASTMSRGIFAWAARKPEIS